MLRSAGAFFVLAGFVLALLFARPAFAEEPNLSRSAAAELLAHPKYRFCSDPDYRLFESQKTEFCATANESRAVCPGLLAACGRPAWDEQEKSSEGWSFTSAAWLGPVVQVLFWGALALGLGLLLWHAWKSARSQALDFDLETKSRIPVGVKPAPQVHGLGLTREHLMQLAERAVLAEKYREALLHLYQATLQGVADLGWVRLRESATSGDYSRSMRRRLNLDGAASMGSSPEDVEQAISHLRALERERFASQEKRLETLDLLERTKTLFHRWSGALILLLGILTQACGGQGSLEMPDDPAAPGGTLLFEELVARHAETSKRRFRVATSVDEGTTAVIVMAVDLSEPEWQALSSWVLEGGALVVVDPQQNFADAFELKVSTTRCDGELLTAGHQVSEKAAWFAFDEIESDEDYFLCGGRPVILGLEWGRGWVTLLASPDLLRNARLAEVDHAALLMDTLMLDDAQVELLGPWTGRGSTSPLQSMIKGHFAWWVLHVLLFFVIAAWGLGRRFGRPSDPPRTHRRAFREHALALAAQYQRVGGHHFALQRFAEWTSEQLRRAGASGTKARKQLDREFATALSVVEVPLAGGAGAKGSAASSSLLVQFSIYRKLRDVQGRRPASSSSRKKKG